ncbi:triose-phosphate isomerase [Thermodesulfobacteriota bacterium]
MDRIPLIAGNWKMNLSIEASAKLVKSIGEGIQGIDDVEVLVAPPFTAIGAVRQAIGKSGIFLSAQNMHYEMNGAYTGEISGRMLQDAGCTHVILGHSERRNLFGETSEIVDSKVKSAVMLGLIPIICFGETLEEREAGKTFEVVKEQLDLSMKNFIADDLMLPSTILAYEPVWAIGTGKNATPDQAQDVHLFVRNWIKENFSQGVANQVRILYGGSVKPENAGELMAEPDIDGALVGGASLKADSFLGIIKFG